MEHKVTLWEYQLFANFDVEIGYSDCDVDSRPSVPPKNETAHLNNHPWWFTDNVIIWKTINLCDIKRTTFKLNLLIFGTIPESIIGFY